MKEIRSKRHLGGFHFPAGRGINASSERKERRNGPRKKKTGKTIFPIDNLARFAYSLSIGTTERKTKMAYQVLTDPPVRCVYMVTGCSPLAAGSTKIYAIKALRQMVRRGDHIQADCAQDHPLYGLGEAKAFVESILARLAISTTVIIEMEPEDSWRHRAIIGAILATLGVSYDKIESR